MITRHIIIKLMIFFEIYNLQKQHISNKTPQSNDYKAIIDTTYYLRDINHVFDDENNVIQYIFDINKNKIMSGEKIRTYPNYYVKIIDLFIETFQIESKTITQIIRFITGNHKILWDENNKKQCI